MRIQRISSIGPQIGIKNADIPNPKTSPIPSDTVNFKAGVSVSLVLLVIKEGYNGLKNNTERANFKNEIAQKMACPDLSNNAKQLVDVLFALAKTKGRDEPANILYDLKDKYGYSETLKDLRSEAIGKLFPLIPVMKNDINSGNAAKAAMLDSMIDSGEYLESPYMYDGFKSLFNASNKESLLLKAMRDKNVWREINTTYAIPKAKERAELSYQPPEDNSTSDSLFHFLKSILFDMPKYIIDEKNYVKRESKKLLPQIQEEFEIKKAIVNTALIHTLEVDKHQDFFSVYNDLIHSQSRLAYRNIAKMLKTDDYGKTEYETLYKKYAEGLKGLSIPEEHLSINYLKDMCKHFKNDKETLAKEFNINPVLCNDILSDFELISKSSAESSPNNLKKLYEERINEKVASGNKYIQDSAGTLVYLSGHASGLKSLLDSRQELQTARNNLKSRMEENNAIYGCKEPYIPTLEELKKAEEKRMEEYRNSDVSLTEADIDCLELQTRINFL